MASKPTSRVPLVTSCSMIFKKTYELSEDSKEIRKGHRSKINMLIDKYMEDVKAGTAKGITNARELVEVIKADLLLSEGLDTDEVDTPDEMRVHRLENALDINDPSMQKVIQTMMGEYNSANDAYSELARGKAIDVDAEGIADVETTPVPSYDDLVKDEPSKEDTDEQSDDKKTD